MTALRLALFVLVLAPLAACDSGTPEASSFSATLSGDVDRQLVGAASVSTAPGIREVDLVVTMVEGGMGVRGLTLTNGFIVGSSTDYSTIDGRGTYRLGGGLSLVYQDAGVVYASQSGAVEITRFRDDYVAGSFVGVLESGTGARIEVEGTFEALANEDILY